MINKSIILIFLIMIGSITLTSSYAQEREFSYDEIFVDDDFVNKILFLLGNKILNINGEADPIKTLEEIKLSYDDGFNKGVASSTTKQVDVIPPKGNNSELNKIAERQNIIDKLEISSSQKDDEISALNTALAESNERNFRLLDELESSKGNNSELNKIAERQNIIDKLEISSSQKDDEISALNTALAESNERNFRLLDELESSKGNNSELNKIAERQNIIDKLEISSSQKDDEISALNTALAESNERNFRLLDELKLLKDNDGTKNVIVIDESTEEPTILEFPYMFDKEMVTRDCEVEFLGFVERKSYNERIKYASFIKVTSNGDDRQHCRINEMYGNGQRLTSIYAETENGLNLNVHSRNVWNYGVSGYQMYPGDSREKYEFGSFELKQDDVIKRITMNFDSDAGKHSKHFEFKTLECTQFCEY